MYLGIKHPKIQRTQPGHKMTTPSQLEFEVAAIQQHIQQQAVAAALAGMPLPAAPTPPTVNVNAVAVKFWLGWPVSGFLNLCKS